MRTKWLLFLFLTVQCIARGQTIGQVTGFDCRLLVDGQVLKQATLASTGGTLVWNADVLSLPIGLHHVTAQVLCHDTMGDLTMQYESFFYRIITNDDEATHHIEATCYIDDDLYRQATFDAAGGVANWDLDMTTLPVGLHQIKVMTVDHYGPMTHTDCYQSFFYRVAASEEEATHHIEATCYINGELFRQEALVVSDGIANWSLDMNSLPEGLHQVKVMVEDNCGSMSRTDSYQSFFYRVPNRMDDVGIIGYDVWVNQEHQGHADVLPRQVVYWLDTAFTVTEQEFRSMSFRFAVEDDVPVVYAQNDLWVMFHDITGKATNAYASYIDIRSRCEVTDITRLRPGETIAMQRPAENNIKWYKIEAMAGDSVMIKTDKACTWQLFSPIGEELYRADGNKAAEWGCAYAPLDGTYYIAVHDMSVTGSKLSISYRHIDGQFELDEADWAILRAFYAQYGKRSFAWDLTDRTNVHNLEGVTIALRHVVEIRLPNRDLAGPFPALLLCLEQLRLLDLGQNGLSGNVAEDIAQLATQQDSLNSHLQELMLSYNDFTGNVGALASYFGELTTLDVASNHFNEVSPTIPPSVALNINNQRLAAVDGDLTHGVNAVIASIPTICYYDHPGQTQSKTLKMQWTDSVQSPIWNLSWSIDNGGLKNMSANRDYRGVNNQDISVTTTLTSNSWTNRQSLSAVFDFAEGDANLTGDVNVTDLQAIVNRIFSTYNNPFNFTAANRHQDDVLNVQDVVGEVNLLLSMNPDDANGNLLRVQARDNQQALASLYWHEGVLYLNTAIPVAAIDIVNAVDGTIRWNMENLGMIVSAVRSEQGEHAVIYSLGDALIPAGVTPIATTSSLQERIVSAMLSDEEAQEIPVNFSDVPVTGVREITNDRLICQLEDGNLFIISSELLQDVDVMICSVDGCVIHQVQLTRLENGKTAIDLHDMIKNNGYYIVVVRSDGQVIATQKLTHIR